MDFDDEDGEGPSKFSRLEQIMTNFTSHVNYSISVVVEFI